jgi:addiction module RelB/DinJ family antitoxin
MTRRFVHYKQTDLVTVSFQLRETELNGVEEVCADMGIDFDSAFHMFVRAVIDNMGIPFDVVTDFVRSPRNVRRVEESRKEIKWALEMRKNDALDEEG